MKLEIWSIYRENEKFDHSRANILGLYGPNLRQKTLLNSVALRDLHAHDLRFELSRFNS